MKNISPGEVVIVARGERVCTSCAIFALTIIAAIVIGGIYAWLSLSSIFMHGNSLGAAATLYVKLHAIKTLLGLDLFAAFISFLACFACGAGQNQEEQEKRGSRQEQGSPQA